MLDIQESDITPRYAFSIGDRVTFGGGTWNVFERVENGFAFRPGNGEGPVQEFTNTQLAQFVRAGDLSHIPYRKPAAEEFGNEEQIAAFLASRTDAHHGTARGREALILAFDSLHEEGRVKCTYVSVDENIDTIMGRAAKINKMSTANNPNLPSTLSGKTLFRWRAKYRKYGLISLYDGSPRKGNRDAKLVPAVLEIITPIIQRYAEPNPPTKKQIHEDVEIAIKDANRWRAVSGLARLDTPSQTTINAKIKQLDPFLVCLAHEGEAAAKRRFSSTLFGVQASRPLERVEIDEWRADLMTLVSESNLMGWLSKEEKIKLGLNKEKLRVLVTVAICVATKCIVGMTITLEGNSDSARQTIEMILDDKGKLAKRSGARMPWCMSGRPGLIVTDCAQYNISDATRRSVSAMGSRLEHCPAGEPQMKAVVERVFRTISTRLIPRLIGRTFSDVVSKGDHDPEGQAALSIEDFFQVLVRWIVDIYHVTPHRGLGGETPFDCWQRLVDQWGVNPSPNWATRVMAFGTQERRVVQSNGVTRLGIQYHHEELAEWFMHHEDREVPILWHRSDLGSIQVEIDGRWLTIPSVHPMFRGLSAAEWENVVHMRRLHNRSKAAIHEDVVHDAIKSIKETNARAIASSSVVVERWPEKRVAALESECRMAFSDPRKALPADPETGPEPCSSLGIDLRTAGRSDARDVATQEPATPDANTSASTTSRPQPEKTTESISGRNSATTRSLQRRTGRGSGRGEGAGTTWSFEEE